MEVGLCVTRGGSCGASPPQACPLETCAFYSEATSEHRRGPQRAPVGAHRGRSAARTADPRLSEILIAEGWLEHVDGLNHGAAGAAEPQAERSAPRTRPCGSRATGQRCELSDRIPCFRLQQGYTFRVTVVEALKTPRGEALGPNGLRYGCSTRSRDASRRSLYPLRFTCKSALFGEPTSGLEPLTCSLRVIPSPFE